MLTREWRNWQTRTFEGRVVTPYGFKSRFSHQKDTDGKSRPFLFAAKQTTQNPSAACGGRATLSVLQSKCAAVPRKDNSPLRLRSRFNFVPFLAP